MLEKIRNEWENLLEHKKNLIEELNRTEAAIYFTQGKLSILEELEKGKENNNEETPINS